MKSTIIIALVILFGFAAIYIYGERRYSAGIDECNRKHNEIALEAFKNESEKLLGLSSSISEKIIDLEKVKPKIIERYTNVTTQIPLPSDCLLDASRLQHINDAIRASAVTD